MRFDEAKRVKGEEVPTGSFILNDHYKRPMSFTAFVDGKDGAKTRIIIDKEHCYVFVGDIWIEEQNIAPLLGFESHSWSSAAPAMSEEDGCVKFYETFTRDTGPYECTVYANKAQLTQLLRENITCKFEPRLCGRSCYYRYAAPRGQDCDCIYGWAANFRELLEHSKKYLQVHVDCWEGSASVQSTLKFKVIDYTKRESWMRGEGDLPFARALLYYLRDIGYKDAGYIIGQNLEPQAVIYTLGYRFFGGTQVTIQIDPSGEGKIFSTEYIEECYRAVDTEVALAYKNGNVLEAARDLCCWKDYQIQFLEAMPQKEAPCLTCNQGEEEEEEDIFDD